MFEKQKFCTKVQNPSFWVGLVILTGILIFIWFVTSMRLPEQYLKGGEAVRLDGEWHVSYKQSDRYMNTPIRLRLKKGDKVSLSHALNIKNRQHDSLLFWVNHKLIKVYLDGKLINDYGYNKKSGEPEYTYKGWILLNLPENWHGKTLTIEQVSTHQNNGFILESLLVGRRYALIYMIIFSALPIVISGVSICAISILIFLGSFFMRDRKNKQKLISLSTFSFFTSLWTMAESGGYQIFAGYEPVVCEIIHLLLSIIPVMGVYFVISELGYKDRKYIKVLFIVSICNFLLIQFLRFAQIADYIQTLPLIYAFTVMAVACMALSLFNEWSISRKIDDPYLYVSLFVFLLSAIADIACYYAGSRLGKRMLFMQTGLSLSVIILFCRAVYGVSRDKEEAIKQDLLQELAYKDLLTGLSNRNAFEKALEYYRGRGKNIHPLVMIIDVNSLKLINDTYGHKAGDEIIIEVSGLLKKYLIPLAQVYRIGGDEFCIIIDDITDTAFWKVTKLMDSEVKKMKMKNIINISIAYGWHRENGEGIDAAFISADEMMYQRKYAMKGDASAAASPVQ